MSIVSDNGDDDDDNGGDDGDGRDTFNNITNFSV